MPRWSGVRLPSRARDFCLILHVSAHRHFGRGCICGVWRADKCSACRWCALKRISSCWKIYFISCIPRNGVFCFAACLMGTQYVDPPVINPNQTFSCEAYVLYVVSNCVLCRFWYVFYPLKSTEVLASIGSTVHFAFVCFLLNSDCFPKH